MKSFILTFFLLLLCASLISCSDTHVNKAISHKLIPEFENRLAIYQPVTLQADLSHLSNNQKEMIKLLIEASIIIDDIFWQQASPYNKDELLSNITDEKVKQFTKINYGPWDRLNNDKPFLTNVDEKNKGAEFYPHDMSKQEFEQANISDKQGLYSLIRRDENKLFAFAYSDAYSDEIDRIASILEKASTLADNASFSHYLTLRANALRTDNYQASDMAWMDMKDNAIELIIGPIETYEDQLFGYRSAFEAYILIKDQAWSEKLKKYTAYLPELQKGLPVHKRYKQEKPGGNSQLNAYDAIYYAGHANAGGKTIAINLPNDEEVQLAKGTRRLQLKNTLKAKFDHIMLPIADQLLIKEQRNHVTFNAFFTNTMFHEVAHGLGIKNTINNKGTVRNALKEHASAIEEGKADIVGLYMVESLLAQGVITEGQLEDYYITFMAGIFRSVRFGASSAHGKANMLRFNYFNDKKAFTRTPSGFYQVNMKNMKTAVDDLATKILILQGRGDYKKVNAFMTEMAIIKPTLEADLQRLTTANIPVDITFKQGKSVLGL